MPDKPAMTYWSTSSTGALEHRCSPPKDKQKALDMALSSHFGTGALGIDLALDRGHRVIPGPDHAPDRVAGSPG